MKPKILRITNLLRPHWKAMTMALVAVAVGSATELLEPWQIKIVLDYLLQSKLVGQWIMHDLRSPLYHHIHRLSLAEHRRMDYSFFNAAMRLITTWA